MKKIAFVLLLCSIAIRCSTHTNSVESADNEKDGVRIRLSVQPRQGFAPLKVTIKATLEGAENSADYYCMRQEWDFGDGAKSTEQPDCTPFGPETEIETEFFASHEYETAGDYEIRLRLGDEKEPIVSGPLTVKVILNRPGA